MSRVVVPAARASIEGAPDLAQDLGLAENLRVEPGGDREQMTHRLRAVEALELARERHAARPGEIAEPRLASWSPDQ